MTNQELLNKIKAYIDDGEHQAVELFQGDFKFMAGKLAGYGDVYSYIEEILEKEIKENV